MKLQNYALSVQHEGASVTVRAGGMELVYPAAAMSAAKEDNHGLSHPFLRVSTDRGDVWALDGLGIYEAKNATITYPLGSRHIRVRAVTFVDRTDLHDALVLEETRTVYQNVTDTFHASLYLVTDLLTRVTLVILGDAPSYAPTTLKIGKGDAYFVGGDWGAFYGLCEEKDAESFVRSYYRTIYKGIPRFCMSNTWGDRSGGSKLCTDFIRKELDCAAELGVDIMQIDDGWQEGKTYAAENRIEESGMTFRRFNDDFWRHDDVKFPGGLQSMAAHALKKGVRMGLWFGPNSYAAGERLPLDEKQIRHFYDDWDVRFVKLDMVAIAASAGHTREECAENYLAFLDNVSHIGAETPVDPDDPRSFPMRFNLDITASDRFGYFAGKQYGTLFVENRYSDYHSYYPHNTLRNLWQLSRWLPADKFQFELLNPRRCRMQYEGDPLGPDNYDMDYLFAVTMAANPLVWLEMQNLAPADAADLKKILTVWRSVRADFDRSVVIPVGDTPDGRSFTGFHIAGSGSCGKDYLLLFRELDDEAAHTLRADVPDGGWTLLASNSSASCTSKDGVVTAVLGKPLSYALFVK